MIHHWVLAVNVGDRYDFQEGEYLTGYHTILLVKLVEFVKFQPALCIKAEVCIPENWFEFLQC